MYLEQEGNRNKESFHRDWYFIKEDLDKDKGLSGSTENMMPVILPHDWSVTYPFDEHADTCGSGAYSVAGIGWYKKKFKVSKKAADKRIYLHFEGAYMHTEVWLNGEYLGLHVYGYTPFSFDITDKVLLGDENILSARIDNARQPGSRWYSGTGITRNVWIEAVEPVHIKNYGTYITTPKVSDEEAEILVETTLSQEDLKAEISVYTEIYQAGDLIHSEEVTKSHREDDNIWKQKLIIKKPKLWSDQNPVLYEAVTSVTAKGKIKDIVQTKFGIRSIAFCPDEGFVINGSRVKLNGVCLHHDGGCVGAAVPSKIWKYRLNKLKQMGCNAIRCSHNPSDVNLLELCDEMGFYVMDEAFDEWRILKSKELGSNTHESRGYSEWFDGCHKADLETMLLRDRNHPCIVIWSIGNEVPEQTSEDGYLVARKLKEICKRLDPTRPVTQANDQIEAEPGKARQEFLEELDIVGYNYVGRWRKRSETLYGEDKIKYPNRCVIGTENPSAGGIRGKYSYQSTYDFWSRPYFSAPVEVGRLLRYTMTHDFVAGDFMWTGIDYLGEAHWPARSASRGVMDTCGFEKDTYYFYKSIWNREEPFVHLSPHWNLKSSGITEGQIIPVLCYTNCDYVEVYANGISYGKKAYSYPAYGMTEYYGHFDSAGTYPNTEDLFLSFDIPYKPGTVKAVGYRAGREVCDQILTTSGEASELILSCGDTSIISDGRDISIVTITAADKDGCFVPDGEVPFHISTEGPIEIIGVDNGNPYEHRAFTSKEYETFSGKACVILRGTGSSGKGKLLLETQNSQYSISFDVIF